MDAADERRLLVAARAGDEKAFGRLVVCHQPGLERFCRLMLGCPQQAHHAVGETLLRCWSDLRLGAPPSSARSWLYRLATDICLEEIDSRETRDEPRPRDI
jgi:RNA polymerase sigma-70 factor, ECF subfamily